MAGNTNLRTAKSVKNDEFYTEISDIEKELKHYKKHFKDAVVFCNCDDPEWSNFWKYFHLNFEYLGLKKLITTHYDASEPTYMMEYEGGADADTTVGKITPLKQNGDFRSPECIELLNEASIVVTNPPFSIARDEFVPMLLEHQKKFIIIGDLNWCSYKTFFPLMKDNKLWFGYNSVHQFRQPDGSMKKFGNKLWFTNLDIVKRHETLDLIEKYDPEKYPKFDNYDAINIDKTLDIPVDYDGLMGVPVSFFDKFSPDQFEIVDGLHRYSLFDLCGTNDYIRQHHLEATDVNGQSKYFRVVIKHKRKG